MCVYICLYIHMYIFIGKLEAYSIAVYVVTQTLTTVGYGDTSADNTAERVGYVLMYQMCLDADVSDVSLTTRAGTDALVGRGVRGQEERDVE